MREDIRQVKNALRQEMKTVRLEMTPEEKAECDSRICQTLLGSTSYTASEVILTYVSTAIEVDTRELIRTALADGKAVACPRCIDGTRQMEFYYIDSLDELRPRTFGVYEPDADPARLFRGAQRPVCVVPGLSFDRAGFRLGYGKGYYDRFLSGYGGWTVGLCYSACVRNTLPHGRFDRAVDRLITEKYLRRCAETQRNKKANIH